MNKPHIEIKVENKKVISAYLYSYKKINNEKRLVKTRIISTRNITKIINDVKKENKKVLVKVEDGMYHIYDKEVLKKYLVSKKVKRQRRFANIILGSTMLFGGVWAINDAKDSKNISVPEYSDSNVDYNPELGIDISNINYLNSEMSEKKPFRKIYDESFFAETAEELEMYTFNFSYDDRSSNENRLYVEEHYMESINYYSNIYGIDSNLLAAIISQENARNIKTTTARGVTQIENVWNNKTIKAYNFVKEREDIITIDPEKLYEPNYAIRVGAMILSSYYQMSNSSYTMLSEKERILASILCYNKGPGTIGRLISKYGDNYLEHLSETSGGDNLYLEHIFSYMKSGSLIEMKNIDGSTSKIIINNGNVKQISNGKIK